MGVYRSEAYPGAAPRCYLWRSLSLSIHAQVKHDQRLRLNVDTIADRRFVADVGSMYEKSRTIIVSLTEALVDSSRVGHDLFPILLSHRALRGLLVEGSLPIKRLRGSSQWPWHPQKMFTKTASSAWFDAAIECESPPWRRGASEHLLSGNIG